jgi:hypothetical protein
MHPLWKMVSPFPEKVSIFRVKWHRIKGVVSCAGEILMADSFLVFLPGINMMP